MLFKKAKPVLPTKPGAVAVSLTLQRTFVMVTAVGVLLQILLLFPLYVFNSVGYSVSFAASFVFMTVVPILYFIVAYVCGPAYPVQINRWFMATLKAVIAVALAGGLQSLLSFFSDVANVHLFSFPSNHTIIGLLIYNNAAELLVLIALVVYVLMNRKKV